MHRNNAITVLPNYRLVPEHTGADIATDLQDFWKWFHGGGLTAYLSSQNSIIDLDFDHVLVSGDSAGGYMALMSALTQPESIMKAVLAQYPMTNYLRRVTVETNPDTTAPEESIIDDHIKNIKPGTVISSAIPPERMDLSYALSAYERYLEFFGKDTKLWPINLIEDVESMPPTWIIHGDADKAVSIEDSKAFVKKWGERGLKSEVRLDIREGEDHGFDDAIKEDEEKWLKDGLAWVQANWLA
jgi:acetyl esterase/lipase